MQTIDETELVGFLEAAYALELDDQRWLSLVLHSLAALCGGEQHYAAYFYDASNVDGLKEWNVCAPSLPPEVERAFRVCHTLITADWVRSTLRSLPLWSATSFVHMEPMLAERRRAGWGDIFNINALDPSGIGCLLVVGCRAPVFRPSARELALYRRLAIHLAAAFRCRRRLGVSPAKGLVNHAPPPLTEGAEAILDAQGRFVHATGPAIAKTARERIRGTAAAIDVWRTRNKRKAGAAALGAWHPLMDARWTLVDSFQENGRRYVVARENLADAQRFATLTDRERQVVVHAVLGFTSKQTAYALGIADATVRVLLSRAANKFGVHTRKELLAHPSLQDLHPA